jgi:hypothetical protein
VIGSSGRGDDAERHGATVHLPVRRQATTGRARDADPSTSDALRHKVPGWRSGWLVVARWVFVPMGAAP